MLPCVYNTNFIGKKKLIGFIMHRSASESAEEKKGVIIEAEVRYVFRIPLVKIEFELIIEAEVRYVFRIPLVKIQENVRGGFAHRKALNKGSHDWRSSE